MEKIQNKDDIISTTFRVYRKDMEKFRNYTKRATNKKQKDCFAELIQILDKINGNDNEKEGDLISFLTFVTNEFNPNKSKESKFFSITGKQLAWISANNRIICDENNRYKLVNQETRQKTNIHEKLSLWSKAVNMQFDINLDIERLVRNSWDIDYNFQIHIYKDMVRNKYLLYDVLELTKRDWRSGEQKQLIAHRFFYINNKKELEEKIQDNLYILIEKSKKEIISKALEVKRISPDNLENELKEYYEI